MFVGTGIVLWLIINEEFFVVNCSLLTVCNCIDPLLLINEIAVEKCDTGISDFSKGKAGRACIVIQEIDIRNITFLVEGDLFLCRYYKINARLKSNLCPQGIASRVLMMS